MSGAGEAMLGFRPQPKATPKSQADREAILVPM